MLKALEVLLQWAIGAVSETRASSDIIDISPCPLSIGIGLPPYRTPREVHVSNQMAATAEEINASYVVALGDNFYFAGIRSDVHDARFQSTFEDVFHQKSLDIPWLVCAGNHDHYGNVTAQVAYSQVSRRWKFPNLYWTHTFSFGKYTVIPISCI